MPSASASCFVEPCTHHPEAGVSMGAGLDNVETSSLDKAMSELDKGDAQPRLSTWRVTAKPAGSPWTILEYLEYNEGALHGNHLPPRSFKSEPGLMIWND